MSPSKVTPDEAKAEFWHVVRACLVEFHKRTSPVVLLGRLKRFRRKVEHLPIEEMDLFYHSEPFDIACRIAQNPLNVETHLARYLKIRDKENENGAPAKWAKRNKTG
jgi:hypothetical protein